MTPASIRILALAAVASLPLAAQQQPTPSASQNSNPQAVAPAPAIPQLHPVTGELENKLDTKDAKAGDSVALKTTETATVGSGVEIPKGSEIKGHIVDVAAKGQQGNNARLTIQLDQAQLKNGQNLPIRSVIESVAPAGTTTQADSAGSPSAPAPSSGAGMTGSQPGNSSKPPSVSSQPGADSSQPAQAGAAQAPGTVVATKGNLAIKTTAIPGVLLIGDVSGRPFSNAAGALLGANQDVHLDGGTVMVVAIAMAPATIGAR